MKYKRYMVFTWSEYDNTKPFDNLRNTFDDLAEAKKDALRRGEYAEDGEPLFCVFDRAEGVIVDI